MPATTRWKLNTLIGEMKSHALTLLFEIRKINGREPYYSARDYLVMALTRINQEFPQIKSAVIELQSGKASYSAPADAQGFLSSDWGLSDAPYWDSAYPGPQPGFLIMTVDSQKRLRFNPAPSLRQIQICGSAFHFQYKANHTLNDFVSTLDDHKAALLLLQAKILIIERLMINNILEPVQLHRGMGSIPANSTPSAVLEALERRYQELKDA